MPYSRELYYLSSDDAFLSLSENRHVVPQQFTLVRDGPVSTADGAFYCRYC